MSTALSFPSIHLPAVPTMASSSSYKARVSPNKYDTSASSEDGSLGPRDHVQPFVVPEKKQAAPWSQPAQTHTVRISLPGSRSPSIASAAQTARRAISAPPARKDLLEESLAHALTFLTFDEIEVARRATKELAAAADRVAPKPLPCEDIAFVRWEPRESPVLHHQQQKAHGPAVFPWRCLNCGDVTVGPRSCGTCGAQLSTSACRAFLGQLRKDLSAELATSLLRMLVPDVTILHVESHTNAVDGRGKGCAWVYVSTVEDALRVTTLHKRVFVDLDADNGEGFWYVQDAGLKGHLSAMADVLAAARGRPVWLPRQPLVAELPAKSMLADYARSLGYRPE
jgi:rubrerythrin